MNDSTTSGMNADGRRAKRIFKWVALVVAALFFAFVLRDMIDPFGDQPYMEISHGDHVHYVPRDRAENVPVGNFPTVRPGPNEMITPEGRVVEQE